MKKITLLIIFISFGHTFGQIVNNTTTIVKIDEFEYNHGKRNTFISQLKNNESFILNYHTQGCFHSTGYKLIFSKKNDLYYVTFNNKKSELKTEQIEQIRKFEKKLNRIRKFGGCTTTDYYELIYGDEIFKVTDETCDWNGYDKLIEDLSINLKEEE